MSENDVNLQELYKVRDRQKTRGIEKFHPVPFIDIKYEPVVTPEDKVRIEIHVSYVFIENSQVTVWVGNLLFATLYKNKIKIEEKPAPYSIVFNAKGTQTDRPDVASMYRIVKNMACEHMSLIDSRIKLIWPGEDPPL